MEQPNPNETRLIAFRLARRVLRNDVDSEDIAQDAVIRLIENNNSQTIWQAVVDSIRKRYGRTNKGLKNRFVFEKALMNAFDPLETCITENHDLGIDLKIKMKKLDQFERIIASLYLLVGYSLGEISEFAGVTESAICARFKDISRKLKRD